MGKDLLSIKNLVKTFQGNKVLNGLSFKVNHSEILGVLGPNGAGKSTTFSIVTGLLRSDRGQVEFEGYSISSHLKKYKKSIGVVPQEISLYTNMTIYENLTFFGKIYGVRGKQLKEKVDELIESIHLIDKRNSYIGQLSGGMKRRVNIAAALIHDPKLIIMDEPTVGIDPQSRSLIWDLILRLREEGKSVIITSHYVDEIERLSDRVLIFNNGEVVAKGTVDSLIHENCNHKKYIVEFYEIDQQLLNRIKQLEDVETIEVEENMVKITSTEDNKVIENILKLSSQQKVEIKNIDFKKTSLEDVFFYYTGRGLGN